MIHECKNNDIPGVRIVDGSSLDEDWSGWVLENKLHATEQDVKAGEATSIGDEVSCSILVINYCPFCGELLYVK